MTPEEVYGALLKKITGGSGQSNVFIATYGVTPYAEIQQHLDNLELVVCYVDEGEGDEDKVCYIYDGANSKNLDHYFHCFDSGASTVKKVVYCKAEDSSWHMTSYDYRNVYVARYGETTYAELQSALTSKNNGVLAVKNGVTYEYGGTVSGRAYFASFGTGSSHLKMVVTLDANGWATALYTMLMLTQQPSQYDVTKKYNVQRASESSNLFKLVEAEESGGGGSGGDFLPLSGGTMTGSITLSKVSQQGLNNVKGYTVLRSEGYGVWLGNVNEPLRLICSGAATLQPGNFKEAQPIYHGSNLRANNSSDTPTVNLTKLKMDTTVYRVASVMYKHSISITSVDLDFSAVINVQNTVSDSMTTFEQLVYTISNDVYSLSFGEYSGMPLLSVAPDPRDTVYMHLFCSYYSLDDGSVGVLDIVSDTVDDIIISDTVTII